MLAFANWRTTFGLFLLTLAVLLSLRFVFPSEAAEPIPGIVDTSPVLMFEFARTPADLDRVFGPPGDPLRGERILQMDMGNQADYALAIAYGLFILSFFAAAARTRSNRSWLVLGLLGIVAALADAWENSILLSLTSGGGTGPLAALPLPVWTKFGLLALCCGAAGVYFLKLKHYILALLCLPAVALILPGMLAPFAYGALAANGIGLGWLAMGIHAASRTKGNFS